MELKKFQKTNFIKTLGAAMLFTFILSVSGCSQPSNPSSNNTQQPDNNQSEPEVSLARIANTQKLLAYLKKYNWISENFSVTYGNNDTEYDSTQAMTFTVNQNDTLTMYNPNGTVYRTFDISINNLSSNPDEYESPQFKLPNESEKVLVFGIADCNTLETRGYDDIVMYITNDNTILPNRYYQNFMKQTNNNNSGSSGTSIAESDINGTWFLNKGNTSQQNITFNNGNITVNANTGSGNQRTATYTLNNGVMSISYNFSGQSLSADYTVTLENSQLTLTGKSGDYTAISAGLFQSSSLTFTR